jgi:hypothetical protein
MKLFLCFLAFFAVFYSAHSQRSEYTIKYVNPDSTNKSSVKKDTARKYIIKKRVISSRRRQSDYRIKGQGGWQKPKDMVVYDTIPVDEDKLVKAVSFNLKSNITPFNNNQYYGFGLELFVSKNFALNYNFGLNYHKRWDSFHYGAPQLVGLYGLAALGGAFSGSDEDFMNYFDEDDCDCDCEEEQSGNAAIAILAGAAFVSVAIMLLPEGISYYIPLNDRMKLSLAFNPLGMEHINDKEYPSYAFALKTHIRLYENIEVVPHFGYRGLYNGRAYKEEFNKMFFGVSFGFSTSWSK